MAEDKRLDMISALKELFEAEKGSCTLTSLAPEDLDELLQDTFSEPLRETMTGYPSRPLHRDLGHKLQLWMDTRNCPIFDLPKFDLLDEQSYGSVRESYINQITPLVQALSSLWNHFSKDERQARLKEIINILGKRGLLDLLGMRKTVGTSDFWPPARSILEATFQAKHHEKSELTVGARALAKHCHRDESATWWGVCTGKESEKNGHATTVLNKILDNALWINIHQLPHDVKIVEARQEDGYGVRWTCDGKMFRGFLEPQMIDGHLVGWRH